jgi:hypothetical protein
VIRQKLRVRTPAGVKFYDQSISVAGKTYIVDESSEFIFVPSDVAPHALKALANSLVADFQEVVKVVTEKPPKLQRVRSSRASGVKKNTARGPTPEPRQSYATTISMKRIP